MPAGMFRDALRAFRGSRRGSMFVATLPGVFADITAPYGDIEAWTYDRFIAPAVAELFARNLRAILNRIPRGAQVLDVGCGGGHALEALAARRPDLHLSSGWRTLVDEFRRCEMIYPFVPPAAYANARRSGRSTSSDA